MSSWTAEKERKERTWRCHDGCDRLAALDLTELRFAWPVWQQLSVSVQAIYCARLQISRLWASLSLCPAFWLTCEYWMLNVGLIWYLVKLSNTCSRWHSWLLLFLLLYRKHMKHSVAEPTHRHPRCQIANHCGLLISACLISSWLSLQPAACAKPGSTSMCFLHLVFHSNRPQRLAEVDPGISRSITGVECLSVNVHRSNYNDFRVDGVVHSYVFHSVLYWHGIELVSF